MRTLLGMPEIPSAWRADQEMQRARRTMVWSVVAAVPVRDPAALARARRARLRSTCRAEHAGLAEAALLAPADFGIKEASNG
jgi:hypothetical protein